MRNESEKFLLESIGGYLREHVNCNYAVGPNAEYWKWSNGQEVSNLYILAVSLGNGSFAHIEVKHGNVMINGTTICDGQYRCKHYVFQMEDPNTFDDICALMAKMAS